MVSSSIDIISGIISIVLMAGFYVTILYINIKDRSENNNSYDTLLCRRIYNMDSV